MEEVRCAPSEGGLPVGAGGFSEDPGIAEAVSASNLCGARGGGPRQFGGDPPDEAHAMPDLETLSARAATVPRDRESLRRLAQSAQRVVVLRAGLGAPLEAWAREFHAHSAQSHEPLSLLNAQALAREELSGAPYESVRRGRVALLEPQRAPESIQMRFAQRLERWRRTGVGAPRVLALFSGEPQSACPALLEALDGLSVRIAPLAQRPADIAAHARAHLEALGANPERLSAAAQSVLKNLPWSGGERELELWLERALLLAGDGELLEEHVAPPSLNTCATVQAAPSELQRVADRRLASLEESWIRCVLAEQGGNVSRCAEVLGIHRSTLHAKLRALGGR